MNFEESAGSGSHNVFKSRIGRGGSGQASRIDPAVKAWLDNVLIPAMVRQYLASNGPEGDNGMSMTMERVQ